MRLTANNTLILVTGHITKEEVKPGQENRCAEGQRAYETICMNRQWLKQMGVASMNKQNQLMLISVLILILVCSILSGCENIKKAGEDKGKTLLAVSIVPQKTLVEAVCGDMAEVVVAIPPGKSPANYEQTPRESEQLSRAKIYFAIGVPTEDANIMPKLKANKGIRIVRLQEEVAKEYPELNFVPGKRDPHIWLSPKRVKVMVEVIAREMSQLDPENKTKYVNNARRYIAELEMLDKMIIGALERVQNRKLIVFHPAFGYLTDDYGLSMYALEQDGKEATPLRLKEMIDLAKKENIKAVFYQAEISSKQSQAFAEEIGGKTVQLDPLAADYTENMRRMIELMVEVMQ